MQRQLLFIFILFFFSPLQASDDNSHIYSITVEKPAEATYKAVYDSLEDSRFYVIFEANIDKNLARNAKRWGDEYNKNKFEFIKSMVVCNPYFVNQVLNLDPDMMALCPLTVSVLHKEGNTKILFRRLTPSAAGSAAEDTLWEVENTVITAIENAVKD